METETHAEIADALIERLTKRGLVAIRTVSRTGSVYVFVTNSRMVIRIANHGKHSGWFRYNIRTDLKQGREFVIQGQRIFLFTADELKDASYRIAHDYKVSTKRNAYAIVKRKRIKRR